MGEGLVKVGSNALANRGKQIDSVVDEAVKPKAAPAPTTEASAPAHKSTTAAESQARMDAIKARQASDDKVAKGLVKPSMTERLKKMVGLD
jgi:hypothetical protein